MFHSNKITIILVSIIIILGFAGSYLVDQNKKLEDKKYILEQDIKVLNSKVKYYIGKDSLQIAEKQTLQLSISELKESFHSLTKDIKDMKLQIKNIKSVSVTGTRIKDSVNITWNTQKVNDTIKIKIGTYHDKWTDLVLIGDKLEYTVKDSLLQVISDGRTFWQKCLFWKPIILKQNVKSFNPNSQISYLQTIQITK